MIENTLLIKPLSSLLTEEKVFLLTMTGFFFSVSLKKKF